MRRRDAAAHAQDGAASSRKAADLKAAWVGRGGGGGGGWEDGFTGKNGHVQEKTDTYRKKRTRTGKSGKFTGKTGIFTGKIVYIPVCSMRVRP